MTAGRQAEEALKSREMKVSHSNAEVRRTLDEYYNSLCELGAQHWWPGKTKFEVIVGAILTQSTSWVNVELAIRNLREKKMLSPAALERVKLGQLANLIRPSGYFRQKAKRLKTFVEFLRRNFQGSLARMFRTSTGELRERLLEVHGIGPETADSILLYAGGRPVFVADTYSKRILARHGWIGEKAEYEEVRGFFEDHMERDAQRFNEFHALIVQAGKQWCRPRDPLCAECPLGRFREEGR
jgi:endonuclease-3 related protein